MLTATAARLRRQLALLLLAGLAGSAALFLVPGQAHADLVRNDQLWVLDTLHAQQAWPVTEGQGVKVAVIDSGVNPGVSDLTGSVSPGPDLTGVGTPVTDPYWGMHGTWMASLIAGHGDEGGGSGILGIAPKAHVLSIRVITDQQDPGYQRYQREPQQRVQGELARAIRYAVAHHAGVISMSLGYGRPSLAVRRALQKAFTHGVVVVASSGNSGASAAAHGKDAPYSFPADYPGVLGVAAVNRNGQPAGFSSDNLSVQVAAPGVKVPAQGTDGKYWLVSGTSPACALTAGVAALIKSQYPHLPPELIREAITSSASNPPSGGYDAQVGFGTVDAPAALTAARGLAGLGTSSRDTKRAQPADGYFGGGPAAIPPAPVHARSTGMLVVYSLLGALCLALVIWAISRLATMRRQPAPLPAGPLPAGTLPVGTAPAGTDFAAAGGLATAAGPPSGDWPGQPEPAPGGWAGETSLKPWSDGGWAASGDLTPADWPDSAGPQPAPEPEAPAASPPPVSPPPVSPSAWPDQPALSGDDWTQSPARPGGWSDPDARPASGDQPAWRIPGHAASPPDPGDQTSGASAAGAQSPANWPRGRASQDSQDDQDTQAFPAVGLASHLPGPGPAAPAAAPSPEPPERAPAPDDDPDPPHRSLWAPGPAGRHPGSPHAHRHGVSRPAE